MDRSRDMTKGFSVINVAIVLLVMAILCVVVLPRYDRFSKTAEAKTYIHQLSEAGKAALEECHIKTDLNGLKGLPSDEELIAAMKKHLGGAVPENPFTKSNTITVQHHRTLAPCDSLESTGGWVWNLVPRGDSNSTVLSKVWLNSDTVNISRGMGESCIQP